MATPNLSLLAIIPFLFVTCVVSCNPVGIPDTGWKFLQPGLERRLIHIYNEQGQQVESLYIYRLDQNQFRLDVAYHEKPQSLENWQTETNALIVLNGGYFRIEN